MHSYLHHIGDYIAATAHLEPLEDLAYRRLIEVYYLDEQPFADDLKRIARRIRLLEHVESVQFVLEECFELHDGYWFNKRCDAEISAFSGKREAGKTAANARWGDRSQCAAKPSRNAGTVKGAMRSDVKSQCAPKPGRNAKGNGAALQTNTKTNTKTKDKSAAARAIAKTLKTRGITVDNSDPFLQSEINPETLSAALDEADRAKGKGEYGVGYVRAILKRWASQNDDLKSARPPEGAQWDKSASGIDAKAKELGIERNPEEPYPLLAIRCRKAIEQRDGSAQ